MLRPAGDREIRESAFEIKFVVDQDTGQRIRERARTLLAADPWASGPAADEYTITSLYFDTPDLAVFNRRGSYRRAKYRIRRYGQSDVVFLERKLRTNDLLTKRRTNVRLEDLALLQNDEDAVDGTWPGHWFRKRIQRRGLGAVCQITYERTARIGLTDYGPIRLTIDNRLQACLVEDASFVSTDRALPVTESTIIEMKFRAGMPAVFKLLVEEFAITAQRISKYRLATECTRAGALNA
jgi:hypothetical protein